MVKTAGSPGIQTALVIDGTARALTVPAAATNALIQNLSTVNLRWTADGTTPTASIGNRLAPGESINWQDPEVNYSAQMVLFRAIRETSTSGSLDIHYFVYS